MRYSIVMGVVLAGATLGIQAAPWKELVFHRDGELITSRLDGSDESTLLSEPGVLFNIPVFSHDFRRMAYLKNTGGLVELCVLDDDGSVCAAAPGLTYYPAWDANNAKLYYPRNQGDGEIWVIDFDLPAPTAQLFHDPPVYRTFGIAISGDGERMVSAHDPSNWTYNNYLAVYDFDSGQETTIYPSNGRRDFFPDYSPVRDEIVWSETDGGCCSDLHDIWIIDGDGGNPIQLTATPGIREELPKFSPDGESIYYLRERVLWVMGRDGSDGRELFAFGGSDQFYYDVARIAPFHACIGFDAPMDRGPVTVRKHRVLPLKARVLDADGVELDDLDLGTPPVLQVLFTSARDGDAVDVTEEALPAGSGSRGNQFEFTKDRWRFNLETRNYTAAGSYRVQLLSGDPAEYEIETCEGEFVIRAR